MVMYTTEFIFKDNLIVFLTFCHGLLATMFFDTKSQSKWTVIARECDRQKICKIAEIHMHLMPERLYKIIVFNRII